MDLYAVYSLFSLTSVVILYYLLYFIAKDSMFSEFLFFSYRFLFAPSLLTISNYLAVKHLNLNVLLNLVSFLFFIPSILIHFKGSNEERLTDKKIDSLYSVAKMIIDDFFEKEEFRHKPNLIVKKGSNSSLDILVQMEERTKWLEEKRIQLQKEIQEKYGIGKVYLIFDYKYVPKKKYNSLIRGVGDPNCSYAKI
ncbi:hypothetical protein [Paenibacillus sp. M2]|uniref:hypothetical protein n=1 Tax=Paenibacillus sp. M2 TaxID=3341793 RepID=UPI003988AEE1